MGTRASDRKFAGAKTRLPAGVVGQICGRECDRESVADSRADDPPGTADEGRIGSGGGGGFDPGAGRVHRLARTPGKGAGGKTRPGRLRGGEGSGEESGGSQRAGGIAQSRKIAFPDGARGSTGAFSSAAASQGVAIGPVRSIRPILRASFLLSFYR